MSVAILTAATTGRKMFRNRTDDLILTINEHLIFRLKNIEKSQRKKLSIKFMYPELAPNAASKELQDFKRNMLE